ncbi:MAG: glycosyltransferase family 2 protein [Treponema sp.]|nr:glycosyltransferase family 2 protein [Treponema sp.]
MSDKVSIIMPCYNAEKYISESINSVISQKFKNWELLIIDDCSIDKSCEIINSFKEKDSRIFYYKTEIASGSPTVPRNMGIEKASGRFIAFLDADDIWCDSKLESQIPLFSDNVSVVFSFYKKMKNSGVIHKSVIKSPGIITYKDLLKSNYIGNLTGVYDTSKVGKIFQKKVHHEDYLMWLDILKLGGIAKNTNSVEAFYRESENSVSGNKFLVFKWQWNILRKELKMSLFKSLFYFVCYAINGLLKLIK